MCVFLGTDYHLSTHDNPLDLSNLLWAEDFSFFSIESDVNHFLKDAVAASFCFHALVMVPVLEGEKSEGKRMG